MADPKIRIRRSATPNKVPTTTQLQLGELAINTYDGKVYLEQDQGGVGVGTTVIAVNPWGVGIGSTAYNTQFTAGKVGVGTTNAQYNLDVGGDINFTGNLYQDGSAFTSGVGIRTAGGTVGWAATIIDFRGPGVTTAYYSSSTGIGTVYFQGGGGSGGGGNASVTVSDSAPSSPSNGDLWFKSNVGELYLWYTDGSSNQWVEASGGSNTVVTSDTAPSSPNDGDLWWNSDTGELKIYYNDGNSSQWVDANSEGGFVQYWTQTNTNGNLGVTTTGFVGIGTTTATDALTVVGAADIDGNLIVSGVSTFSSEINLPDNIKASFGTGDDGSIKHTGSNLQIQETTGNIQITNYANDKDVVINSDDGSGGTANYFLADGSTGEALLYHYGNEKIKTTSTGASVTGDLAASGNVTGVAATFTGNVTVEGVLTYEDVKNVDAIGIVTARKGIKALAGGANIVDGTTTDELNVTGVSTFNGLINAAADIKTDAIRRYTDSSTTTKILLNDEALKLHAGHASQEVVKVELDQVSLNNGANLNVSGVTTSTGGVKVGTAATICSAGNMTIDKPGAGIITATKFIGDGSDLTGVISGIGIGTAGGVVGYAATIVHFKGAGVTTAYYNASTGIGTVFFHSAGGGGGGNANVTISDTPPGSPSAGDLWWESDIGELKIYYSDGDSSQWVDASGADSLVQIGTSAPTGAVSGDLWFNSETGDFMVYYTDANSSAWVSVNAVNSNTKWLANSTGIHTSSYVGIGTTTVTDALTVVGATDLDGTLLVSGITTFQTHVYHGDNDHAIFGDGSDLSIYHTGSESRIIDSGTGDLKIGGSPNVAIVNGANNSIKALFGDTSVSLNYSGSKKFETTTGGAKVWGTVGSANTALVVVGDARITGILTVGTGSLTITDRDINAVGVVTGANFKSGTTNVHNVGVEAAGINVLGADTPIGTGATVYNSGLIVGKKGAEFQGVVTATTFVGALTGNASTATLATNAQGLTGTPNITVGALTASTGQFSGNVNVLGTLTYEDVKNVDSAGIATARQGLRITGGGLDVVGVSTFNDNVKLLDNDKLQIGNSADLEIFHNSSNSWNYIRGVSNNLAIQAKSGENSITCYSDDRVELYFDHSKKFETTSTGVTVTGKLTTTDDILGGDNVVARFGTGQDLQIWHNGTNSLIQNTTGLLLLNSDDIWFKDKDDGDVHAKFIHDGAVELYHNNVKKFATNSDGVDLGDNVKLRIGDAPDYKIYHNGTTTIHENYTGDLIIKSDQMYLASWTSGENYLHAVKDGRVALYYDNFSTFETVDNGIKITAKENNHARIHLWADEGDDGADKWEIMATTQGNLKFYHGASSENTIVLTGDGSVDLYHDNSKKLETTSTGIKITSSTNGDGINLLSGNNSSTIYLDANRSSANNGIGQVCGRWNGTTVAQMSFSCGSDATNKDDGFIWFGTESAASNGNVNATERLRINSVGNVSIGGADATPSNAAYNGSTLHLYQSGSSSVGSEIKWSTGASGHTASDGAYMAFYADNNMYCNIREAGNWQFYTANAERLRITAEGELLLGDSFSSNINTFKMGIKESANENAAILFLDTDNMRGGICGISKGTNELISGTTNVDFVLGSLYADTHIIYGGSGDTNGRIGLTVKSTDGKIGINNTSPSAHLHVQAATDDNPAIVIYRTSGGGDVGSLAFRTSQGTNAYINWRGGGAAKGLQFYTSTNGNDGTTVERFRINANSNGSAVASFGTGTTHYNQCSTPDRSSFKIGGRLHVDGAFGHNAMCGLYYNCYSGGNDLFYGGSYAPSGGDGRASAITMRYGGVAIYTDSSSTAYSSQQQITTMANRFAISSIGDAYFCTTSGSLYGASSGKGMHYRNTSGTLQVCAERNQGWSTVYLNKSDTHDGSDVRWIDFWWGGSQKGNITFNGSNGVNYNTTSDYRLKKDDVVITNGISRVKQLRPITFKWKEDNTSDEGFFAHEVQSVVPGAVSGTKDQVVTQAEFDADSQPESKAVGDAIHQQMDSSKLVPVLTAALKEAIAKIEVLETKVAALESS